MVFEIAIVIFRGINEDKSTLKRELKERMTNFSHLATQKTCFVEEKYFRSNFGFLLFSTTFFYTFARKNQEHWFLKVVL